MTDPYPMTEQQLRAEVERLNGCLRYEQHRADRIGTHGPGCHTWGPEHYECAMRVLDEVVRGEERLLRLAETLAVERNLAQDECAALRTDAQRYQGLRDNACEGYPSCEGSQNKDAYLVITGYDYPMTKEQKNAAIDAALAAQPNATDAKE